MLHPAPEQIYHLILEDYFFSLVDCGVPAGETPLFPGNIEREDLTPAVGRRLGLSDQFRTQSCSKTGQISSRRWCEFE